MYARSTDPMCSRTGYTSSFLSGAEILSDPAFWSHGRIWLSLLLITTLADYDLPSLLARLS